MTPTEPASTDQPVTWTELRHTRSCSAWHDPVTKHEINRDKCTCGLKFRIQVQTAETIAEQRETLAIQAALEQAALACERRISDGVKPPYYSPKDKEASDCAAGIRLFSAPAIAEQMRRDREDAERQAEALDESVKLQSHYAALLNMHDGGKRMVFANSEEWMNRLKSIDSARKP